MNRLDLYQLAKQTSFLFSAAVNLLFQDGKFRLKRPEPVDLCLADVPQEQLAGECLVCTAFDATVRGGGGGGGGTV